MTFEDFYTDVIAQLGGTIVDVELDENDIKSCLRSAIRTFRQMGPNNYRRRFLRLPVKKDLYEYRIPASTSEVTKIHRPNMGWDIDDMSELALAAYQNLFGSANHQFTQSDYLTVELEKQLTEHYRRVAAWDVSFDHDKVNNTIRLHDKPRLDQVWIVECWADLCEAEYMDTYWIFEWTVAEAHERLGRAYRKIGSVPGPSGNEIQLSGGEMIQDAKDRKEQLLQNIQDHVAGDVDFMGIMIG